MPTKAISARLPANHEDLATALLLELGSTGLEVRYPVPGLVELLAYFPADCWDPPGTGPQAALADRVLQALRDLDDTAEVRSTEVEETDWVAHFRETFGSFSVGRFHVAPIWAPEPPPPDQVLLRVDPGRAFGTGTHETTQLCLSALDELAAQGSLGRVLDLGTGSGLLGVAAVRLGAPYVVGSDIDEAALGSARRHAEINRVSLQLVLSDGCAAFRDRSFDLIVANLTLPLLLTQRHEMRRVCRSGGSIVLSGLLLDDVDEARAGFAALGETVVTRSGEWAAVRVALT
jgi:ribosomal protein L11 methyltransferase